MTELQPSHTKGHELERAGASWTAGTAAAVLQPSNGTNSRFSGIADVWITISRIYTKFLEEKSKKINSFYYQSDCAQFLRHSAIYFPTFILNEWKIFYKIVHQTGGKVIIIFRQVYY